MTDLRTERLRGRACAPSDTAHVAALFGDPEVRRWTSPPGCDWSDAAAERMALRLAAHWLCHGWGPRIWFEGRRFVAIGGVQFALVAGRGAIEIAFAVLPRAQGRGIGRELVTAIMAESTGITREVRAAMLSDNHASRRLLSGAGFRADGRVEEEGRLVDLFLRTAPGEG